MKDQLIIQYLQEAFEKSSVKFLILKDYSNIQMGQLYCTPDKHCTYEHGSNKITELWLQWGRYCELNALPLLPKHGTSICDIINTHPHLRAPKMMYSTDKTIIVYLI